MEQAGASTYHSASLPGFTETASAKPGNDNPCHGHGEAASHRRGFVWKPLHLSFPDLEQFSNTIKTCPNLQLDGTNWCSQTMAASRECS